MIISISPPSSASLRNVKRQTKRFFGQEQSVRKKNRYLLAIRNSCMVLVKKREILISFDINDIDAITFLQKYLIYLFKDVYIGVDLNNPVTDKLDFVVKFPRVQCHEK